MTSYLSIYESLILRLISTFLNLLNICEGVRVLDIFDCTLRQFQLVIDLQLVIEDGLHEQICVLDIVRVSFIDNR